MGVGKITLAVVGGFGIIAVISVFLLVLVFVDLPNL